MISHKSQTISPEDVQAVADVLQCDWLTTGPKVAEFERAFADFVGAKEAVAVSNGTAALHAAMFALGIEPGDEVLLPAMTFAATANSVVYQGGRPIFVDVDVESLLLNPGQVEAKLTASTKAIIAVDYAGQPCDYERLRAIADKHGVALVADACHALGGSYQQRPVGSLAQLNTFSLHPVKNMTTGEGGVITTNDAELARKMRGFRNHGIDSDSHLRESNGTWYYEMHSLGFNYRLTDFQCALGLSQLQRLPGWIARRQEIARQYDSAFLASSLLQPLSVRAGVSHAYHLYVVKLNLEKLTVDRTAVFKRLRARGINVNVHYIPVHLHPFYAKKFGVRRGLCPLAEKAYRRILSLPIHPNLSDRDVSEVSTVVLETLEEASR
ncbi:MAG: UDP-4-amino-4,6-dideoxy-N-acetyl-beta-L-altrosamine transaminase [Calditrichaeota bacterium]|nr:UDP-4-amino-4,6-dideoxy-N-acetyl-beta-L-altrosamine transaminase [Calditrichota bacterium]